MQAQLTGRQSHSNAALDAAFAARLAGMSNKEFLQFLIDFCQRDEMRPPMPKYLRADLGIVKAEALRRMNIKQIEQEARWEKTRQRHAHLMKTDPKYRALFNAA